MTVSDWEAGLYHYRGEVTGIVDGDTISVAISLGCHVYLERRIRLLGINAPELFSGTDRAAGLAAKAALEQVLPVGSRVYLRTHLDRTSFDRLLAELYRADGDTLIDVAAEMIAAGHGIRALGGDR